MPEAWRTKFASTPAMAVRMSRQPRRETGPELAIRRELHRRGLRYFIHRRPIPSLRRSADILFPRVHVAVFVDGCFWHGCPEHGNTPSTNSWYWPQKIAANRRRDLDTDERLIEAGWLPMRIWEHDDVDHAVSLIAETVARRRL
jgi:DNA mismatch endonuclease (patch repair protein)